MIDPHSIPPLSGLAKNSDIFWKTVVKGVNVMSRTKHIRYLKIIGGIGGGGGMGDDCI